MGKRNVERKIGKKTHPLTPSTETYENDEQKQMKKYVYYHSCAALAMQHFYWLHYHKNKPWNKPFEHELSKSTSFDGQDRFYSNAHFRFVCCFLKKSSITLCKYLRHYSVVCNDSEHWAVLRFNSALSLALFVFQMVEMFDGFNI